MLLASLLGLTPSGAAACGAPAFTTSSRGMAEAISPAQLAAGEPASSPVGPVHASEAAAADAEADAEANTRGNEQAGPDSLCTARPSTLAAPPVRPLEFVESPENVPGRVGTPPAQRPPRA